MMVQAQTQELITEGLANALRLMIEAQLALSGGEMAGFRAALRDLGGD